MTNATENTLRQDLGVVFDRNAVITLGLCGEQFFKNPCTVNRLLNIERQNLEIFEPQIGYSLSNLIFANNDGRQKHGDAMSNKFFIVLFCCLVLRTCVVAETDQKTTIKHYGLHSVIPSRLAHPRSRVVNIPPSFTTFADSFLELFFVKSWLVIYKFN